MTDILQSPKTLENTFGGRLRSRRKELNLSQESVGVSIGLDESCSRARISRYETGVHEPNISTARKLADTLMAPVAYFYCERDSLAELILKASNFSDLQISSFCKKLM